MRSSRKRPELSLIIDELQRKGEQIELKIVRLPIATEDDFPAAFEAASKAKVEALFVMDDGAIAKHRQQNAALAAKHGLPIVSIYRDFAASGGLISYGPNLDVVYRAPQFTSTNL